MTPLLRVAPKRRTPNALSHKLSMPQTLNVNLLGNQVLLYQDEEAAGARPETAGTGALASACARIRRGALSGAGFSKPRLATFVKVMHRVLWFS